MTSISTETVPQTWNDQDERFFRITSALFSTEFCYGAGVLLASYDDEAGSQSESSFDSSAVATASPKSPVLT